MRILIFDLTNNEPHANNYQHKHKLHPRDARICLGNNTVNDDAFSEHPRKFLWIQARRSGGLQVELTGIPDIKKPNV